MDDVVILSAVRTPIGTFQGALSGLPAHALYGEARPSQPLAAPVGGRRRGQLGRAEAA